MMAKKGVLVPPNLGFFLAFILGLEAVVIVVVLGGVGLIELCLWLVS